ncbi:hypothetical protein A2U01_0087458, partial [Trifolium medium]|nr:hypothetical protein [Trifolium medium]
EEYTEMLQTLALPGRDWHYTIRGARSRLHITDMMLVAKGWAVRDLEAAHAASVPQPPPPAQ